MMISEEIDRFFDQPDRMPSLKTHISATATKKIIRRIFLFIYSKVIISAAIVFAIIRSAVFFLFCLLTSKNLHNNMLDSVIKSKMRFFDLNPIGRIMNRFTKDMSSIDEVLPSKIFDFFQVTLLDSIRRI